MSDATSSAIPGWAWAGALSWGLLALLAVVGCGGGSGGDDAQPQTAFAFDMGPPLSDTSYAIVVQSEYGVDTLRTAVYRRKLRELRQQQSQPTQSQGQAASAAGTASHRRMLEQFVARHVMAGAAKANDVEVDSTRLERKMERRRNQYESEAALRAALKEQGLTVDSVRKQQANTLRIQQLGEKWAGQVDMPSQSEIEEFRRDPQNRKVRARHIAFQVGKDAPSDTIDSVRARARAVLDSIQNGAPFAEMARRHSDAVTASMGGMKRVATPKQMDDRFAEAVQALQDTGDVTEELIRTERGFHLFKLVDQARLTRGQAKWKLFSKRRQQAMQEKQRALLEQATVHINPDVVRVSLSDETRRTRPGERD